MNNDELPMRAETASAYLDGEIDAAERLAVESDDETMGLVESFSLVRSTLADVGPVSDDVRSAAIAAALAEFDAIHSAAPVAAAAPARVTALHTRRIRAYRLVTGVAAAAVVLAVAVAALNSSGSDSKSSSATEASINGGDANLPALKVGDTTAAIESAAAPAAAGAAAGTAAPGGAADSAATAIPEIDDEAALRDFAAAAVRITSASPASTPTGGSTAQPPQPQFTAISPPACITSSEIVLGAITVSGAPAFAVSDSSTGVVRAIDATDCRVYFSVTP